MPNKLTKRYATPLPPPGRRSRLSRVIALFFLFIARETAAQTPPEEGSLFVTIHLPYGISVEIPRSWHIVAGAAKEVLGTGVAGDIDLSRMLVPDNHVLLRANATPSDQPASMAVAFFPQAVVALRQEEEPSPSELTAYDQELRQKVENALRSQGIELREWGGTRQGRLDGHFALVSEYRRRSQGFPSVWEQVNALPLNGGMAVLYIAHSEQEGTLWRSVVMRIRSSFQSSETSSR